MQKRLNCKLPFIIQILSLKLEDYQRYSLSKTMKAKTRKTKS
uniref:Uncharacterized protein n=1 Tax=Romanomermis culicivorax TaxID=13658 RepID=A0A915L9Y6_ROMCU